MAALPSPGSFDPATPAPQDPCPFCAIAAAYPTFSPREPPPTATTTTTATESAPAQPTPPNTPAPSSTSSSPSPAATPSQTSPPPPQRQQKDPDPLDPEKLSPSAYVVLSTPALLAFLDIMPLSRGHLLLCPRAHRPKLTDVTPAEARDLGGWLRVLSKSLVRATGGVADWNVVQNNGAAAAQVVGHVHYHLIPRPDIRASGRFRESFTMFGRGVREELDDDDAALLARRLRGEIAAVLREEEEQGEASTEKKWKTLPREKL